MRVPFSVLLSVYWKENPAYLRDSLDSVFGQTVRASEVVLVEDGPLTPDLDRVVEEYEAKYPELKVVKLPQNRGLGLALNEGMKHCTNELIARMDTDDICKPYRFERQLAVFQAHPEIDVCSSWIDEFVGDIKNVRSKRCLPETHEEIVRYAKGRSPINHPAVMYKKSKVLHVGGYQGFPEDSYLWVKMIIEGARFYNIQESLLWFRFSPDVLKRRGGWKYAKNDVKSQWGFYRLGFLNFAEFLQYTTIRVIVRLMPNNLRLWVYKNLLRR